MVGGTILAYYRAHRLEKLGPQPPGERAESPFHLLRNQNEYFSAN
jgi:hypothetical protein